MPEIADEPTARLPAEARAAGLRFDWQPGVLAYDMVLPEWPHGEMWMPLRYVVPRASKCYQLGSGAMVRVKPDCRC